MVCPTCFCSSVNEVPDLTGLQPVLRASNGRKIEAHRDWKTLSAGCDRFRSNVADWSDEDLWKAYIKLIEAEAAFRIHKSDLSLRPNWHHKEDPVLAHIFLCLEAYVLWKTRGQIRL